MASNLAGNTEAETEWILVSEISCMPYALELSLLQKEPQASILLRLLCLLKC